MAVDLVLDGDNRTLTVVLPSVRADGVEERVATFAVVTTNRGSLAGPRHRRRAIAQGESR